MGIHEPYLLSYHGYRFPPEIISHAVWLDPRFCLGFRDAEDLLATAAARADELNRSRHPQRPAQCLPIDNLPWRNVRPYGRSIYVTRPASSKPFRAEA